MPHHECRLGILMCEINSKHERGMTFTYLSWLCHCSNETARAIFHFFSLSASTHSSTNIPSVFGNIVCSLFEEIRLPSQNALAAFALVIRLLVLNLLRVLNQLIILLYFQSSLICSVRQARKAISI